MELEFFTPNTRQPLYEDTSIPSHYKARRDETSQEKGKMEKKTRFERRSVKFTLVARVQISIQKAIQKKSKVNPIVVKKKVNKTGRIFRLK